MLGLLKAKSDECREKYALRDNASGRGRHPLLSLLILRLNWLWDNFIYSPVPSTTRIYTHSTILSVISFLPNLLLLTPWVSIVRDLFVYILGPPNKMKV